MNYLIVTNSSFYVQREVNKLKEEISLPEFNFIDISEKLDVDFIVDKLMILPMFPDNFKLTLINIALYSKKELETILTALEENSEFNIMIGVYYLKDKLDKLDNGLSTLFKKFNFNIKKLNSIDSSVIKKMLNDNNLQLNVELFEKHDDMDSVVNDIAKISCLDNSYLNENEVKKYLSDSLDSNIFELIDCVLNKEIEDSINKLRILLAKENQFVINLLMLKHFNLLRLVKKGGTNEEVAKIECFSGGKGKSINPYRFNLLKKSNPKINLDFAIQELLNNDMKKSFDLELSLLNMRNK